MSDEYHTITPENIDSESFYNCSRLSDLTKYADIIAAIKALDLRIQVRKDDCGNVRQIIAVDAGVQIYTDRRIGARK